MNEIIERPSIVDIFNGISSSKSSKLKKVSSSLTWRQTFQTSEIYPYVLSDGRILSIGQIQNGEIKGLGTGTFVWPAAHGISFNKYLSF